VDERGRGEATRGEYRVRDVDPRRSASMIHRDVFIRGLIRRPPDRGLGAVSTGHVVGGAVGQRTGILHAQRRPRVHQREGPRRIGPMRATRAHEAVTEHLERTRARSPTPTEVMSTVKRGGGASIVRGNNKKLRPTNYLKDSTVYFWKCPAAQPQTKFAPPSKSATRHVATTRARETETPLVVIEP
jgi:hypothetical protein